MTVTEWIYIIGIAVTILSMLFSLFNFFRFLSLRKKEKKLPKRSPKHPKKRKSWNKKKRQLEKRKKQARTLCLLFFLFCSMCGSGAFYYKYYQSINLTTEDADAIVQSYYLLKDFQEQLVIAKTAEEDQIKVEQNILYLSRTMASYGTKKASDLNTEEGQLALNRYYAALMEIGKNANVNYRSFYGSEETINEYLETIEKIKKNYEAPVFSYYKVDENALKEE